MSIKQAVASDLSTVKKDIERNRVFLCLDGSRNAVGTVTIKKNEISRLFVLPSYQGMGYGTEIWMWNLIELLWEIRNFYAMMLWKRDYRWKREEL